MIDKTVFNLFNGSDVKNYSICLITASFAVILSLTACSTRTDQKVDPLPRPSTTEYAKWGNTATLKEHRDAVNSVAWSPDGTKLASASDDGTLKVWDPNSGSVLSTLKSPAYRFPVSTLAYRFSSVAWSPDGEMLASGCKDGTTKLWDLNTGELLKILSGKTDVSIVHPVAWSSDGKILASGSGVLTKHVELWDPHTEELLHTLEGQLSFNSSIAWSPSGKQLASAGYLPAVELWDPHTGKLLKTLIENLSDGYSVRSVAWSPDGEMLATNGSFVLEGNRNNAIRLWDPRTGKLLKTFERYTYHGPLTDTVYPIAWCPNPNDGRLASAVNNKIQLWNQRTGKLLQILTEHTGNVNSVAWSPNGKVLASASDDKTICLWHQITTSD